MVVEAKDEHGAVAARARRVKLFAEKVKYVTADTAFFVMVDPIMIVVRGTVAGQQGHIDVEAPWGGLTIDDFAGRLRGRIRRDVFSPYPISVTGKVLGGRELGVQSLNGELEAIHGKLPLA